MQLIYYITPTLLKRGLIFPTVNILLFQPKIVFIFNHFTPFNAADYRVLKAFTN